MPVICSILGHDLKLPALDSIQALMTFSCWSVVKQELTHHAQMRSALGLKSPMIDRETEGSLPTGAQSRPTKLLTFLRRWWRQNSERRRRGDKCRRHVAGLMKSGGLENRSPPRGPLYNNNNNNTKFNYAHSVIDNNESEAWDFTGFGTTFINNRILKFVGKFWPPKMVLPL